MDKISVLLYRRLTGQLSKEEMEALEAWMAQNQYNKSVADRLSDLDNLGKELRLMGMTDTDMAHADIMRRIAELHRPRRRSSWITAAAAVALLCIGIGSGMLIADGAFEANRLTADNNNVPADSASAFETIKHGETKATLTTQAGQTIILDKNDTNKNLASLIVDAPTEPTRKILDLKLEVPRGGEFKVMLEDSTEVWLNSESTLRYPDKFGADERRVEVDGEAYFSVKPDEGRPFYVVNSGQQIQVYGTKFNVRGYADDATVCTTLESGSIAMSKCGETGGVMLSPGHQAIFDKSDQDMKLKTVNPSIYTGWRHGKFVFEEQSLEQIMKDLSHWYDFKYIFTDDKASGVVFKGSIPRYSDLDTAIQILEASGGITFALGDDDVILISSKGT